MLTLVCILNLVGCMSTKYTCRVVSDDDLNKNFELSSRDEPFVTDEERDELITKAIRNHLEDLEKQPITFTYEITSTHFGVFENKETILCWVKIVYGEGFTTILSFIIQ